MNASARRGVTGFSSAAQGDASDRDQGAGNERATPGLTRVGDETHGGDP
jgi:hypothetical protein